MEQEKSELPRLGFIAGALILAFGVLANIFVFIGFGSGATPSSGSMLPLCAAPFVGLFLLALSQWYSEH